MIMPILVKTVFRKGIQEVTTQTLKTFFRASRIFGKNIDVVVCLFELNVITEDSKSYTALQLQLPFNSSVFHQQLQVNGK